MEKTPNARPLALPLEDYLSLPDESLSEAARVAGVTVEKLRELARRAQERKANDERALASKAEIAQRTLRRNQKLRPSTRAHLPELMASTEMLATANKVELEAYRLLNAQRYQTGVAQEAFWLLKKSQDIRVQNRFYELTADRDEKTALALLTEEKMEESERTNLPELQRAISSALDDLERALARFSAEYKKSQSDVHNSSDSFGSAEKYNVNAAVGYVKNPRPRRYNDALEHD